MDSFQAVILGIIQGLTEFLPVSSSGHLVLFQHIFGLKEPEVLFDICLHVGTLMAVVVVFFKEILHIVTTLVKIPSMAKSSGGILPLFNINTDVRIAVLIVIGSIPTAIMGFLFKEIAEHLFGSTLIVGMMLIVTGTFLWLTRNIVSEGRPLKQMTIKDAAIIGLVQGLAIIPGISRSGSTISAALFLGINREVAGRYSFLLSIPAILGALVFGLDDPEIGTSISMGMIAAGTFASAVVGWIALKILLGMVKKGQLYRFSPYCWIVGLITLVVGFF